MDINVFLTTLLLVLGAFLLVFMIILCVKLIYTVDRTNLILNDLERKLKSINGVFNAIDTVTDAVTTVSDTFVAKAALMIEKIFRKKK